jgi:N-acetylmuramoyl-L-alanine amidase
LSKNNDQSGHENASNGAKNKTTTKIVNKIRATKGRPFLLYTSAFVMLLSLISIGYYQPADTSLANTSASDTAATSQAASDVSVASLDEKLATDIAASFAVQTKMPVASNVANLSVSLEAQKAMSQTSDNTIAKPQIIQPVSGSRSILVYKAKPSDTVASVAAKYNLQPETIRWANNIASDNLEPGRNVVILPLDGVLYTAKDGDTIQAIASKYKSSPERIVAFNDLEVKGISKDVRIVIPGGSMPETERPGYQAPATSSSRIASYGGTTSSYTGGVDFSRASQSVGNSYAPGNCTWYAYERRAQLGRPVGSFWGNANTWAVNGMAAGFAVNNSPAPGAIMQNGGGYGHVAIVEQVHPDGSVTFSDMNGVAGFNRVGTKTIDAGSAASYSYIH